MTGLILLLSDIKGVFITSSRVTKNAARELFQKHSLHVHIFHSHSLFHHYNIMVPSSFIHLFHLWSAVTNMLRKHNVENQSLYWQFSSHESQVGLLPQLTLSGQSHCTLFGKFQWNKKIQGGQLHLVWLVDKSGGTEEVGSLLSAAVPVPADIKWDGTVDWSKCQ